MQIKPLCETDKNIKVRNVGENLLNNKENMPKCDEIIPHAEESNSVIVCEEEVASELKRETPLKESVVVGEQMEVTHSNNETGIPNESSALLTQKSLIIKETVQPVMCLQKENLISLDKQQLIIVEKDDVSNLDKTSKNALPKEKGLELGQNKKKDQSTKAEFTKENICDTLEEEEKTQLSVAELPKKMTHHLDFYKEESQSTRDELLKEKACDLVLERKEKGQAARHDVPLGSTQKDQSTKPGYGSVKDRLFSIARIGQPQKGTLNSTKKQSVERTPFISESDGPFQQRLPDLTDKQSLISTQININQNEPSSTLVYEKSDLIADIPVNQKKTLTNQISAEKKYIQDTLPENISANINEKGPITSKFSLSCGSAEKESLNSRSEVVEQEPLVIKEPLDFHDSLSPTEMYSTHGKCPCENERGHNEKVKVNVTETSSVQNVEMAAPGYVHPKNTAALDAKYQHMKQELTCVILNHESGEGITTNEDQGEYGNKHTKTDEEVSVTNVEGKTLPKSRSYLSQGDTSNDVIQDSLTDNSTCTQVKISDKENDTLEDKPEHKELICVNSSCNYGEINKSSHEIQGSDVSANKTASREGSVIKEGLLNRAAGISERAALITRQQVGSRLRTRTTHFPLDIICSSKMQYQQTRQRFAVSEAASSSLDGNGISRHRLSSLDHVQPLVLDLIAADGGTVRSKSASRIGSGHHRHGLDEGVYKEDNKGGLNEIKYQDQSKAEEIPVGRKSSLVPCPIVAPLDAALTNRIKMTIDSCAKSPSPTYTASSEDSSKSERLETEVRLDKPAEEISIIMTSDEIVQENNDTGDSTLKPIMFEYSSKQMLDSYPPRITEKVEEKTVLSDSGAHSAERISANTADVCVDKGADSVQCISKFSDEKPFKEVYDNVKLVNRPDSKKECSQPSLSSYTNSSSTAMSPALINPASLTSDSVTNQSNNSSVNVAEHRSPSVEEKLGKRTSLLVCKTNLLYIDEGESSVALSDPKYLSSLEKQNTVDKPCDGQRSTASLKSLSDACEDVSGTTEPKMDISLCIIEDSEIKSSDDRNVKEQSKLDLKTQEFSSSQGKLAKKNSCTEDSKLPEKSAEDICDEKPNGMNELSDSSLDKHTLEEDLHSKVQQHDSGKGDSNSKLYKDGVKDDNSHSVQNDDKVDGSKLRSDTIEVMEMNTDFPLCQLNSKNNSGSEVNQQESVSQYSKSELDVCSSSKYSPSPVPETEKLAKQIIAEILEDVFYISRNEILPDEERKTESKLGDNCTNTGNGAVSITVTDAEISPHSPSCKKNVLGREESIEEYEQALEVVTPDPGHGFSHSTASVATVVRVDTPNYPQTHQSVEDEEIEDVYVDAREDVNEVRYAETSRQQIAKHSISVPIGGQSASNSESQVILDLSVNTSDAAEKSEDIIPYTENKTSESVDKSLSVSRTVRPDARQPILQRQREGNIPEDGSVSSGDHITDPDMLASASASSTGSEMSWTSGGGPVARRDLLPLDEDEEEVQWRALLAVNPPDSDEERTGYESDEDFDTVDAEMRRLEEKLRRFERELGEDTGDEEKRAAQGKSPGGPLLQLRSQDLEALRISPLPEVYPAVCTAKTKHLSLMNRLQVQEYEESCSGSGSDSDDAVSSEDSADFLFVKTKIKLKPGERKCRSLDQKRPKNDNILNETCEISKISKKEELSCACEGALDLSSLALPGEAIDDESICSGCNVPDQLDIPPPPDFENVAVTEYVSHDTYIPENPECLSSFEEKNAPDNDGALCNTDDSMLLGYIWHEDDGMAAVDFEGLEEFYGYEGQGALMIMFEDDMDEDVFCEDTFEDVEASEDVEMQPSQCLQEDQWKTEAKSIESPTSTSSNKSQRTFVSAFKNSLRKASKYLGPKSENQCRKVGSPTECQLYEWPASNNNNTLADHETSPVYSHIPSPLDEESSAGVYNVQSGQVTPATVFSPHSDSDGRDILSCSSGEYYATPAVCINTSDEDPVNPPIAPAVLPPAPPPRWVQWRPPVVRGVDSVHNEHCVQDVSWYSPALPPALPHSVQMYKELPSQPLPVPLPPPVDYPTTSVPVHVNDMNSDMQFYLVGIPGTESADGNVHQEIECLPAQECIDVAIEPCHTVVGSEVSANEYIHSGELSYDSHILCNRENEGSCSCDTQCQCPNQRLMECDNNLLTGHLPHLDNVPHPFPAHKPTSVKQLKRKQQERIQRQEAEEGIAALGCTFCMGVPLTRPRPPENSTHWRQSSPHPKAIADRRSWPPRK